MIYTHRSRQIGRSMAVFHFSLVVSLLLSLCLLVPFTQASDVRYCDKKADYAVKVSGIEISPNPVARGRPATFSISATAGEAISGGKLVIDVAYFGFHIYSETDELCGKTSCPISAGDFLISHSQDLPGFTPPIDNEEFPTLLDFEEKCPPGGSELVILYTTSLRGIRKTFEDCCSIRFLLESFRVLYHERDVSMHLEFREELWRIAGGRVVPPRLFIKGRHIGGADEVVGLHEQGRLRNLLRGIPPKPYNGPCNGCGGLCFVVCFNCNGSCKVIADEGLKL
ncbi:hypothetical protein HYC85_025347 [Camellia sinensis]|uniref:MD-2-related lipid-recognition domain-containing protein n=1 Tax=Camellia sinensis TaxID=4442 RepID=A0A7J7GD02_CAMSI|nr:hypothetical protein HYC85_025347 [Camellia sinensis]